MKLTKLLEVLLGFVAKSSKSYDDGNEVEALGLAVNIRMLFHDTRESASLLNQLQMKNDIFLLSTAPQFIPVNVETYNGLVGMRSTDEPGGTEEYVPLCNMLEASINKWHVFDDWWNELVVNHKAYTFSRKDIVLMIANKDGGTYIDGEIDESYAKLNYDNSLGWIYSNGVQESHFSNSAAYATMREIAHEVLIAIEYFNNIKSYTRKAIGKVNAMYIDNMVYFAAYECEKDPSASKFLVDSRLSRIEKRDIYCDSLVLKEDDSSKHERFVVM